MGVLEITKYASLRLTVIIKEEWETKNASIYLCSPTTAAYAAINGEI